MPSLLIKDMSVDLHRRLREAAEREHRSMNKQVIAMLDAALQSRTPEPPPPVKGAFPLRVDWLERAVAEGRK